MPSPAPSASSCDDCTVLRSERLLLRPWNVDDAPALFELARDPRVGPPAGWAPHASVDESRQVIRDVLSAPHCFAAFLEDGGALVGCVGLTPAEASSAAGEGEAELGYWLGVPFWGKGLATEASRELVRYGFTELGLSAIWACYYEGNERSHRVMERLGMAYQRSAECNVPLLGERRVEHCMCLLRDAWAAAC